MTLFPTSDLPLAIVYANGKNKGMAVILLLSQIKSSSLIWKQNLETSSVTNLTFVQIQECTVV